MINHANMLVTSHTDINIIWWYNPSGCQSITMSQCTTTLSEPQICPSGSPWFPSMVPLHGSLHGSLRFPGAGDHRGPLRCPTVPPVGLFEVSFMVFSRRALRQAFAKEIFFPFLGSKARRGSGEGGDPAGGAPFPAWSGTGQCHG